MTIANFVSGYSDEIESLFEQVLLVCDEQGLLGKELFALDGCKMSSDAAKEWSLRASCPPATFVRPCTSTGTFKELENKRDKIQYQIHHHITEHKSLDKNESLNDERRVRSEQAIETLTRAHEKIDKFLKSSSPGSIYAPVKSTFPASLQVMGEGKQKTEVKSNITDNAPQGMLSCYAIHLKSAKMTTSKGTIQGYNGIATVDKKHQVIVDAQAFGEGEEHHTLQPVITNVQERFKRLGIKLDNPIFTADTGYANEANMKYLHENNINGYIPDNKFRERDPRFSSQKENHGKRKPITGKTKARLSVIPASEFDFNPVNKTCVCPAKEKMWLCSELVDRLGHEKIFFEGRLIKCRTCELKQRCMHNPDSANGRKGHDRQVSFIINKSQRAPNYTVWMKQRIDSDKGKLIYSHRMSVVVPVFGNIGSNKRLNRFSLRGKKKVQGQWQLYCLIHNIEKLKNYGQLVT